MKIFSIFLLTLLSASATTVLDNLTYVENTDIFTAEHDIVEILLTLYTNFVFIVERNQGNGEYKGLFALKNDPSKNPKKPEIITSKVMDNGKCLATDNYLVYIGANDGIYVFNYGSMEVIKYGNLTFDVSSIQKHSKENLLYIVSDSHLYKVTENGTKIEEIKTDNNVQKIVLDGNNNLYFYEKEINTDKHKVKVLVDNVVVDIRGLPEFKTIQLARPYERTGGAILVLDNRIFRIFADGSSLKTIFVFESAPTAYCFDSMMVQFFGHEKKLFSYNNFEKLLSNQKDGFAKLYFIIYNNATDIYV